MADVYAPGDLIANRYEVVSTFVGGMGVVYLCADHSEQDRPVALKTFKPEYLPHRAARDHFLREGATWVELGRHPHIVRAYRVEYVGDAREVYLVLEWVAPAEGKPDASLRSWLVPGQPLPMERALIFALHIARGMKHATTRIPGLVHRDLKPSNILVGRDGKARVSDFGVTNVLARLEVEATTVEKDGKPALTGRAPVGTALYRAPEQWTPGASLDARADIYAFGCILYEMVTGKTAAMGKDLSELKRLYPKGPDEELLREMEQIHRTGRVEELPRDLPAVVRELVQRCMAVSREDRYGSWMQVEAAVMQAYRQAVGQDAPAEVVAERETRAERVAAGWSYHAIGASYYDIGKLDVAAKYFAQAAQVGKVEREPRLESMGLSSLGLAQANLGDPQQGVRLLQQALAIAQHSGDRARAGTILGNLGGIYAAYGHAQQALGFFKQALAIAREVGDRAGEAAALGNLGNVAAASGDIKRAIEFFEQHLATAREIGDRAGEGRTLANLGAAYLDLGQPQQAVEEALMPALNIAREIGDWAGAGKVLANLGSAYHQLGDARRAVQCFERYLAIAREVGDRVGEGVALSGIGAAYAGLGQAQQAIAYLEQALAIAQEVGDTRGAAMTSFNLAVTLTEQGQQAKALPHAEFAAQVFAELGHAPMLQKTQALLGNIQGGHH